MMQVPPPPDFMGMAEWQALHREGMLVRGLLCSATNAISRASYADRLGEYFTAFFGFSLGLERLAKLCLVADYALSHSGNLPPPRLLSKRGHDVSSLIREVQGILARRDLRPHYSFPELAICENIIACLRSFAEASLGRYANFDALGNPDFDPANEPVTKWWAEVGDPILKKHFEGSAAQKRAADNAAAFASLLGSVAYVAHTNEAGEVMSDSQASSYRTAEAKIVQKYGRYYTLLVARWLASSFKSLAWKAAYEEDMMAFFGHWELFYTFTTEDRFLRDRRNWPLA